MVVLYTEPIPILALILSSVIIIVILFFVKKFVTDPLMRRTLKEYPIILFMGPPGTGKKRIIEKLTGAKVKTKTYPFVGRFRVSDGVVKDKNIKFVCFHSVIDHKKAKMDNINLLDKKPSLIVFIIDVAKGPGISQQRNIIENVRLVLPGIPLLVAMDKKIGVKSKSINDLKKAFGKAMIGKSLDNDNGIQELKARIEELI